MSSLKNRIIGIINVLVRYTPLVIRLVNSEAAGMLGVLSFILCPIRPGRTDHAPSSIHARITTKSLTHTLTWHSCGEIYPTFYWHIDRQAKA